jgi:signal transduction histidine kinase
MGKRGRVGGFSERDALRLLLCVGGSWAAAFLALTLVVPELLRPTSIQAISLSLASQASQLESKTSGQHHRFSDAPGDALRLWAAAEPPPLSTPAQGEQAAVLQRTLRDEGFERDLLLDPPSLNHWLGGYWMAVSPASAPTQRQWVYASAGTALPWLWPAIRIGSLLLGGSCGMALFLRWQLQRPLERMLQQLPTIPSGELLLVPEEGMSAMRELSIRINRVLEQLNHQRESRRRFLQGLAHDLGSPLTRLSMRVERLEELPAPPGALGEQLPLLRGEIDRMISLTHLLQEAAGEQSEPFQPRLSAIDELCERVAASYRQQPIELAVPRLLARVDQSLIERALQNLIDNAISHGRPPIRLSGHQHHNLLVLQVEDGGAGLASANLLGMPRITPADDRGQRRRSGVGISIVERCCQLHGGRLLLKRSSLGGLQAQLQLPLP